jgi:hypothetical protein
MASIKIWDKNGQKLSSFCPTSQLSPFGLVEGIVPAEGKISIVDYLHVAIAVGILLRDTGTKLFSLGTAKGRVWPCIHYHQNGEELELQGLITTCEAVVEIESKNLDDLLSLYDKIVTEHLKCPTVNYAPKV